ncbi:MAG: hypothetical protein QFX33_04450 [Candidatus Nezhaarchaeota archaeon]|nr:hypothetical protein [Candidatus Nezhaarchaeota archaeon]
MPQVIKCVNCGYVLYKGNDLVPPREVIKKFHGKCPKCASTLNQTPISIDVQASKGR